MVHLAKILITDLGKRKMTKRILSILASENLQCLPSDKVNLDIERFSEYRESEEHPADIVFENPLPQLSRIQVEEINKEKSPSIFKYFLDGSRRTYKVADIILDKRRYLPIIAGQVGVSVVCRQEQGNRIVPLRDYCKFINVITFPDTHISEEDISFLQNKINENSKTPFVISQYRVKIDRDPIDLGIAEIMRYMQDLEVNAVAEMSKNNMLQNDSMLVIDGPLRFKKMRGRNFDIVQFRNVIGLSKSFKPSFTVGKGRRSEDVGSITSCLEFSERTPVYKTIDDERNIGMWYLRIRPRKWMSNPLQGVVKMECFAIDQEQIENGLDSEIVNTMSGFLLHERNVTPYKADSRWANHIYPIYLAETYLKSSFMSDTMFKALF